MDFQKLSSECETLYKVISNTKGELEARDLEHVFAFIEVFESVGSRFAAALVLKYVDVFKPQMLDHHFEEQATLIRSDLERLNLASLVIAFAWEIRNLFSHTILVFNQARQWSKLALTYANIENDNETKARASIYIAEMMSDEIDMLSIHNLDEIDILSIHNLDVKEAREILQAAESAIGDELLRGIYHYTLARLDAQTYMAGLHSLDPDDIVERFEKAADIYKQTNDLQRAIDCYDRAADLVESQGPQYLDKALALLRKSRALISGQDFLVKIPENYARTATVLSQMPEKNRDLTYPTELFSYAVFLLLILRARAAIENHAPHDVMAIEIKVLEPYFRYAVSNSNLKLASDYYFQRAYLALFRLLEDLNWFQAMKLAIEAANALILNYEPNEAIDAIVPRLCQLLQKLVSTIQYEAASLDTVTLMHIIASLKELTMSKRDANSYQEYLHLRQEVVRLAEKNNSKALGQYYHMLAMAYGHDYSPLSKEESAKQSIKYFSKALPYREEGDKAATQLSLASSMYNHLYTENSDLEVLVQIVDMVTDAFSWYSQVEPSSEITRKAHEQFVGIVSALAYRKHQPCVTSIPESVDTLTIVCTSVVPFIHNANGKNSVGWRYNLLPLVPEDDISIINNESAKSGLLEHRLTQVCCHCGSELRLNFPLIIDIAKHSDKVEGIVTKRTTSCTCNDCGTFSMFFSPLVILSSDQKEHAVFVLESGLENERAMYQMHMIMMMYTAIYGKEKAASLLDGGLTLADEHNVIFKLGQLSHKEQAGLPDTPNDLTEFLNHAKQVTGLDESDSLNKAMVPENAEKIEGFFEILNYVGNLSAYDEDGLDRNSATDILKQWLERSKAYSDEKLLKVYREVGWELAEYCLKNHPLDINNEEHRNFIEYAKMNFSHADEAVELLSSDLLNNNAQYAAMRECLNSSGKFILLLQSYGLKTKEVRQKVHAHSLSSNFNDTLSTYASQVIKANQNENITKLAESLRKTYFVTAIDRPNEFVASHDMPSVSIYNDEWREIVEAMIVRADIIVMILEPDFTMGVNDELLLIGMHKKQDKTLLVHCEPQFSKNDHGALFSLSSSTNENEKLPWSENSFEAFPHQIAEKDLDEKLDCVVEKITAIIQ
ncbi:CpXC domain-containing protein [Alteromonas macleodii]|uniref:CpXC domain-containing protein n=1 Tax=Alteromonas macleodii TaxID=28108 RepID=UPI0022AFBF3C|nr:CpXC domain-containing protein [Alteromonas macleodii]MCZ4240466.1 CpXC domain-containing protein [Alteromonas macleodii]